MSDGSNADDWNFPEVDFSSDGSDSKVTDWTDEGGYLTLYDAFHRLVHGVLVGTPGVAVNHFDPPAGKMLLEEEL